VLSRVSQFALYFPYLLLFNFQGPSLPLSLRPLYYITSLRLCQVVLQKFFEKILLADFYQLVSLCDLYIISYSGSFVKRFCKSFLKSFSLAGALCALSLTALLLYHIPSRLSTPFWKFSSIRH